MMQVLVPGGINDACWNGILIITAYLHVKCTYSLKFSLRFKWYVIGLLILVFFRHLILNMQCSTPYGTLVSDSNGKTFSNGLHRCIKFYSMDLSVSTEKHSFMLKIIILNQAMKISKPCIYESSQNHFSVTFENQSKLKLNDI